MNHVPTILLVFGAGLACGVLGVSALVYAGERLSVVAMTPSNEHWFFCSKCRNIIGGVKTCCACDDKPYFEETGKLPATWQRVRVTARRVEP